MSGFGAAVASASVVAFDVPVDSGAGMGWQAGGTGSQAERPMARVSAVRNRGKLDMSSILTRPRAMCTWRVV